MINALQTILREAGQRLSDQFKGDAPALLAAIAIVICGFAIAWLARRLLTLALKRMELDGRLRRSSFGAAIDPRGALSASRIAIGAVYWGILAITALAALQALGSHVAAGRLLDASLLLAPRVVAGAAVVVAGMWLGMYLGRSALIWAVNEDLPAPRTLAAAVRALVVLGAAAVAADMVNLGDGLFRAIFIVVFGGAVLTASLALGLGSRDVVRRYFEERSARGDASREGAEPEKIWNHL